MEVMEAPPIMMANGLGQNYVNRNRSKSKSKTRNRNNSNKKNKTKKNLRKRLGLNKDCPPGFILRKPHYKKISETVKQEGFYIKRKGKVVHVKPQKNTILVKATCVKNTSAEAGREQTSESYSRRLAKQLKKGELRAFGYNFRLPDDLRHEALVKAVDELSALQVYHKLDAVTRVFRDKNPEASAVFSTDRDWVEAHFKILQ